MNQDQWRATLDRQFGTSDRRNAAAAVPGDAERGRRLYEQHAGLDFWCEVCGRSHPLREHRECRRA